jgi:hypothetical protein
MRTGVAALLALGALAAAAPIAQADHKPSHSPGSNDDNQQCKKPAVDKAFVVKGTLDAPVTDSVVDITVTGANRHARNSGEIADQDPSQNGVQVDGADYTVDGAADPFELRLSGYEDGEDTQAGDKVRIKGKVPLTRKKCAEEGATLDDRYGEPDVKKIKVIDQD